MTLKIYNDITEIIGSTPLIKITENVYAKLEYLNPAGSVKDRAALYMINDAEKKGILKKGSVIIEPTSGNTGIGLAAVAAVRGYKVILTMPETMSIERRKLLSAYGAEIVLTDGKLGMSGAVKKAEEIAENTENSFIAGQFYNKANALAHYETTGPEIYSDTDGQVNVFVAGVGTGGTLTGTARYLKEKKENIEIVAVEPHDSPLLSKGVSGAHTIQGIGANFIPELLDVSLIDKIITVKGEDAFAASKMLARQNGILVGISSGAAFYAALKLSEKEEYKNKKIVVLLPDTGDRYLSTPMFD
ncbi:MAG: cysteine synthase A [Ruminococcaceae bacterium]|nr:cysteine synthase A [Oscillospiraceae bacterium]